MSYQTALFAMALAVALSERDLFEEQSAQFEVPSLLVAAGRNLESCQFTFLAELLKFQGRIHSGQRSLQPLANPLFRKL